MKLTVRISVVALAVAGAFASSFTTKSQTTPVVNHANVMVSSSMPVPSCGPNEGCTLP